jgi:hypothetical protein
VSLGGACRAREAPLPLPPARITAGAGSRRAPERHGLSLDFYARSCPAVEQIVGNVTAARLRDHPAAGPAVLRLFYHDCFVEVRKQREDAYIALDRYAHCTVSSHTCHPTRSPHYCLVAFALHPKFLSLF